MCERKKRDILPRRRASRLGLMAVVLIVASFGGATAQSPARCDSPGGLPANTQLQVTQQQGRALVEIVRPGSTGRKVSTSSMVTNSIVQNSGPTQQACGSRSR